MLYFLPKKILLAIVNGLIFLSMLLKKALVGPRILQISLPSGCNHNCPFCITDIHGKGSLKGRDTMSVEDIKSTISQAAKEYTLKFNLVSNGEPLMYPQIREITDHIFKETRGHGTIKIITNGTLVEKLGIDYINENKIELWLSLHSGDFETWNRCHRSMAKEPRKVFDELKENLIQINSPVTLHNVMSILNYQTIETVFDFAVETDSHKINFSRAQKFDDHDFDSESIEVLKSNLESLKSKLDEQGIHHNLQSFLDNHMDVGDEPELEDNLDLEEEETPDFYQRNNCYFNFVMALVDNEGNYGFCGTGPWMGNLRKEKFKKIYKTNSSSLRKKATRITSLGGELEECKCDVCPHKDINVVANKYVIF